MEIIEGFLVFAKLLVAIANQASLDGLAFSIALLAKKRQGLLKFRQRGARTFLGINLPGMSQHLAGPLSLCQWRAAGRCDGWRLSIRHRIDNEQARQQVKHSSENLLIHH